MKYVTYDTNGSLTGAYIQEIHPDHAGNYIEVSDTSNWLAYRANAERTGIEPSPPVVAPVPVPQSVTMRQACIQLELDGLLDDVEAVVATLPRIYQIEWQRASVVMRNNPLVEIVRQQKEMTEAQIDDLFITAATL